MGTHGNKRADKLTIQATAHPLNTQFQHTRTDLKAYIKKTCNEKWRKNGMQHKQTNYQKLHIIYTYYLTPYVRIDNEKNA